MDELEESEEEEEKSDEDSDDEGVPHYATPPYDPLTDTIIEDE